MYILIYDHVNDISLHNDHARQLCAKHMAENWYLADHGAIATAMTNMRCPWNDQLHYFAHPQHNIDIPCNTPDYDSIWQLVWLDDGNDGSTVGTAIAGTKFHADEDNLIARLGPKFLLTQIWYISDWQYFLSKLFIHDTGCMACLC